MKTTFLSAWTGSLALLGMVLGTTGCEEEKALLAMPLFAQASPSPATSDSRPVAPPATPAAPAQEPASPGEPPPSPIPALPDNFDASKSLAEIVKLVQSGISEEIMLSFIRNSTNVYQLNSDEIVYLNDLGISSPVIQALIEKSPSSESIVPSQEPPADSPLPPGVALTQPAPGIYPAADPGAEIVQVPKFPAGYSENNAVSQAEAVTPPPPVQEYLPAEGDTVPTEAAPFYEPLSPYGVWYNVPEYGYVWQPTVSVVQSGWRPYADAGRWLWSSSGWYWYSDYSWGWAPFHYGRWTTYPSVGWVWVPDRVWGPSWVSWRYSNYYSGWAPLPPYSYYVSGYGLFYNNSSVSIGFGFGYGYDYYTYIPNNRFCDYRPHHYYVHHHHHKKQIHHDSKPHNEFREDRKHGIVNQGISHERIARSTRGNIPRVEVRTESNPDRFDATGRRERLVSEGNNLVVTKPPPPSVTSNERLTVARRAPIGGSGAGSPSARLTSSSQPATGATPPSRASGATASPRSSRDASPPANATGVGSPGLSRTGTVAPSATPGSLTTSRSRATRAASPPSTSPQRSNAGQSPPISRAPQSTRSSVTARPPAQTVAPSTSPSIRPGLTRSLTSRSSQLPAPAQPATRGTQIRSGAIEAPSVSPNPPRASSRSLPSQANPPVNRGSSSIIQSPRSPRLAAPIARPSLNRPSSYSPAPSRPMVSPRTSAPRSVSPAIQPPRNSGSRQNFSPRPSSPIQRALPNVGSPRGGRSVSPPPSSRSRSVQPAPSSSGNSRGSSNGRNSRR